MDGARLFHDDAGLVTQIDSRYRINSLYDAFRVSKSVKIGFKRSSPGRLYSRDFEIPEMACFRFWVALCFCWLSSTSSAEPLAQVVR